MQALGGAHPGQQCSPAADPAVAPGKAAHDRICASCHLFGTTAPSYHQMASERDWNAHKVAHAAAPQPDMVPLKLTPEMLDALAAYINSFQELSSRPQCRKWRMPVKTMAMPALSAAAITSSSRREPPGWITAVMPAAIPASSPSANGKNASDAITAPRAGDSGKTRRLLHVGGLGDGDLGAVDPARLTGADPDRRAILGEDDRVRLDVLRHRVGEDQIGDLAPRSARAW